MILCWSKHLYLAELLSILNNTDRCVRVCVCVCKSCGISLLSVRRSTGVVCGLAAHVGIFDLYSEQGPICTHTELVPLQAFVEVQFTRQRGVRDARWTKHHGAVQNDAVLLCMTWETRITWWGWRVTEFCCALIKVLLKILPPKWFNQ